MRLTQNNVRSLESQAASERGRLSCALSLRRSLALASRFAFTLALLLLLAPNSFLASFASTPSHPRPASINTSSLEKKSGARAREGESAAFDGERAFAHVKRIVEMGPRPAGSPESAETRRYIVRELKSYGLKVSTDEFNASTPIGARRMANVLAELKGESAERIVVASHYDTKLFKEFRFVGANDAGSSTGALLELARTLSSAPRRPRFTYWFVFFDGEEAFCRSWDECSTSDAPDNTYGSRRLVSQLKKRDELRRVRALVLLDMIGYKNLELPRDASSTRWLVDVIWETARELGHAAQFVRREEAIGGDDHEPFMREGVDAVDIIQLTSYPYWHTAEDTLDKISPRSLQIVGDVVAASLPRIEERLSRASSKN
ncbi:MAG TPA: M28 family peptidase [Pyrinomonadaceae bacterium]|jgi:hypothetical protein